MAVMKGKQYFDFHFISVKYGQFQLQPLKQKRSLTETLSTRIPTNCNLANSNVVDLYSFPSVRCEILSGWRLY